ncbi:finger ccch domain-containing protein [Citrus sinensis]|uniref:Finger ccch domain-containing protein n=1 Tax=Citrus sinensis TaxID=2711 RepID=A0ACB8MCC1_CITSI|nr:finger ccch domain-containing protein [Citrus sinensis]
MANSSGNHHQEHSHGHGHGHGRHPSSFNATTPNQSNGNSITLAERWSAILKHNPGISSEWTLEEQAILEDGLQKYASDRTLTRYAKIAVHLNNKTVRDVALRCRWMTERVIDPSVKPAHFAARSNVLPYASTIIPPNYDDGFSLKAIGGNIGDTLEKNARALNQISANLAAFQVLKDSILLNLYDKYDFSKLKLNIKSMATVCN